MLPTDFGAGSAAREVPLKSPPREHGGARELFIAVLIATTLGIVLFVVPVIVPPASAAGGCGGG